MNEYGTSSALTFGYTRRAIENIKDPMIKRDFENMLSGVEFCFAHDQRSIAVMCANAVVAMAIGLNGTLTPEVSVGILDGLIADAEQDAVFKAIGGGGGLHKRENHKCVSNGPQPGDAACQPQNGSVCYTIDGAGGCGGTSGFFFPWTAVAVE